jgi:nucleoside-diphosphate-sugar epimerase
MNTSIQSILVTGATGFIGQHLINRLLQKNIKVRAFDLPNAPFPREWQGHVEIVMGDIRDAQAVEEAARGVECIIHLAAIAIDWGADELHRTVTVEGTRNIMLAAAHHRARVILTSSIAVYGTRLQDSVLSEDLPWGTPAGIYGHSKQQQELLARDLARQHTIELVVLRCGNVYGPHSPQWVDGVLHELRRRTPALVNGGNFDAGLLYVGNLLEALLLAATQPQAPGGIYNIADGFGITWRRYFNDLARISGTPRPQPIPRVAARILAGIMEPLWHGLRIRSRPPLTYETYNLVGFPLNFPIARARAQLGYNPVVGYEAALDEITHHLKVKGK